MPWSGDEPNASRLERQYWARPVPWALAMWLATKPREGDAALAGARVSSSNCLTGFVAAAAATTASVARPAAAIRAGRAGRLRFSAGSSISRRAATMPITASVTSSSSCPCARAAADSVWPSISAWPCEASAASMSPPPAPSAAPIRIRPRRGPRPASTATPAAAAITPPRDEVRNSPSAGTGRAATAAVRTSSVRALAPKPARTTNDSASSAARPFQYWSG